MPTLLGRRLKEIPHEAKKNEWHISFTQTDGQEEF